jgi:integrase
MAKLTERSIKKLPRPAHGAAEYSDDLLPSLVLRVHSTGGHSWCARYRVKGSGQQRRLTLGKWPALSIAQARELASKELRRVANGADPSGAREAAKAAERTGQLEGGFADEARRFIEVYSRQRNKSWRTTAHRLGLKLVNKTALKDRTIKCEWEIVRGSPCDRWRKRTVNSVTKRDIVEALDAANERGPVLANRVHAALARFFSWAVERGLISISPATGTKAPNREQSRDRVLTPEELSAVWWAAEELKPPFNAFVQLLILTAARRNEVAGMTGSELAAGVWTIPKARAKNSEPNMLPLPPRAVEIVDALPRSPNGLLLTTTGTTPISGFSKMKRILDVAVAKRMKIAPWTLHDLRRSVATGLGELGTEPHVIDMILGHRPLTAVAGTYNRSRYLEDKKTALVVWGDAMFCYAAVYG